MKMKWLLWTLIWLVAAPPVFAGDPWKKFVARDGSFSFHYPEGWQVKAGDSTIEVNNPSASEQFLLVALPLQTGKNPRQYAEWALGLFRKEMPDLEALSWNESGTDTSVAFQVRYTESGRKFMSDVLVLKGEKQANWFSYSAPEVGYSERRALSILQGVTGSFCGGDGSASPGISLAVTGESRLDRNLRAFLFVLEFSLGSPLNGGQEKVILDELRRGWQTKKESALAKFDAYPQYVKLIMTLDRDRLEELRRSLNETVRSWLNESDASDPAVSVIRAQLKAKGQVLIAGDPPLTVMAADAYSEMIAYGDFLRRSPDGDPESVSSEEVAVIRKRLGNSWEGFSSEDRTRVALLPGLWVSLRSLLRYGSEQERSDIRSQLKRLPSSSSQVQATVERKVSDGVVSTGQKPMSVVTHNVLMSCQQMTFNHYLFCRGFRNTIGY